MEGFQFLVIDIDVNVLSAVALNQQFVDGIAVFVNGGKMDLEQSPLFDLRFFGKDVMGKLADLL